MDRPAPQKEFAISSTDKKSRMIFLDCHVDLIHQFAHFGTVGISRTPNRPFPQHFGPEGNYTSIHLGVSSVFDFDEVVSCIKEEEEKSLNRNKQTSDTFDIWQTTVQAVKRHMFDESPDALREKGHTGHQGSQGELFTTSPEEYAEDEDDDVGRIGRFLGLE